MFHFTFICLLFPKQSKAAKRGVVSSRADGRVGMRHLHSPAVSISIRRLRLAFADAISIRRIRLTPGRPIRLGSMSRPTCRPTWTDTDRNRARPANAPTRFRDDVIAVTSQGAKRATNHKILFPLKKKPRRFVNRTWNNQRVIRSLLP